MDPTTEETLPLSILTEGPGEPAAPAPDAPAWVTLGTPAGPEEAGPVMDTRRILLQLVVGIAVVLAVVTLGGAVASRRLAEREAVNDAAGTADVLAEAVVQPAISDELLAGDPETREAFDRLVHERILGDGVVRVKIWSPDGTIVYSDQPELIGRRFGLEAAERQVLRQPRTIAEISDLDHPENALDRQIGAKLVEVYRPVWTPSGQEALFEIYTPYDVVGQRTGQLWRGFAGVTLTSLLLFIVLLSPILVHLLGRVRRAQAQRETLLERAVDASAAERRRIAASLHDGPVQDLAASGFVVAGAAAQAAAAGQRELADDLTTVSASVRTSIRALRSLLVDIYPPSLADAGLTAALADLAQTVRGEGLTVLTDLPVEDDPDLTPDEQRVVYRVAQETLRNAGRHATPCTVTLALRRATDGGTSGAVLDVVDDGPGFDVGAVLAAPEEGHFGLRLLADSAAQCGGRLEVAAAPGAGTHWRLTVGGGQA